MRHATNTDRITTETIDRISTGNPAGIFGHVYLDSLGHTVAVEILDSVPYLNSADVVVTSGQYTGVVLRVNVTDIEECSFDGIEA